MVRRRLLDLPVEVLYLILRELRDSPKALLGLERVCRKLHKVANNKLWLEVYVYNYSGLTGLHPEAAIAKRAVVEYLRKCCEDCDVNNATVQTRWGIGRRLCDACRCRPKYKLYTTRQAKAKFGLSANDLEDLRYTYEDSYDSDHSVSRWTQRRRYYAYHLQKASDRKKKAEREEQARLKADKKALAKQCRDQVAEKRKETLRKELLKFDIGLDEEDLDESKYSEYLQTGKPAVRSLLLNLRPLLDRRNELRSRLKARGIKYSDHKELLDAWVRNPVRRMKEVIVSLVQSE